MAGLFNPAATVLASIPLGTVLALAQDFGVGERLAAEDSELPYTFGKLVVSLELGVGFVVVESLCFEHLG